VQRAGADQQDDEADLDQDRAPEGGVDEVVDGGEHQDGLQDPARQ
jgi:hypothetical protein